MYYQVREGMGKEDGKKGNEKRPLQVSNTLECLLLDILIELRRMNKANGVTPSATKQPTEPVKDKKWFGKKKKGKK